jgi:hypothetical protein
VVYLLVKGTVIYVCVKRDNSNLKFAFDWGDEAFLKKREAAMDQAMVYI